MSQPVSAVARVAAMARNSTKRRVWEFFMRAWKSTTRTTHSERDFSPTFEEHLRELRNGAHRWIVRFEQR